VGVEVYRRLGLSCTAAAAEAALLASLGPHLVAVAVELMETVRLDSEQMQSAALG